MGAPQVSFAEKEKNKHFENHKSDKAGKESHEDSISDVVFSEFEKHIMEK